VLKNLISLATGAVGSIFANWQVFLAAIAISAALGAAGTWRVMSWHEGSQANAQSKAVVRLVTWQSHINVNVGEIVIRGVTIAAAETSRRQQEIPSHVTPAIDRAYPVPLGFVRMWNDASHGPIPGPSAGGDADPSGVPLSDVAHAHTADEGTLDVCRVQLAGWWSWYDQQAAAWNKATGH
jgi:hypothetical protein